MRRVWPELTCEEAGIRAYPGREEDIALSRVPFAGDASLKIERNMYREDPAWERCLGGKEQRVGRFYNHNLCNIFPVAKYGADPWREKLMPQRGGERRRPLSAQVGWQPCLSAPEAVTEAVANIRAYSPMGFNLNA